MPADTPPLPSLACRSLRLTWARRRNFSVGLATALALTLCPANGVLAQSTATAAPEDTATRRVLKPEEFARFVPRTALDMVEQIPGFSVREGGGERGLGQVDTNVLINGRRISGKSNGPIEALRRIPAGDVVQLEIVDGASLDLAGLSGQVLNVITSTDRRVSGQFNWQPRVRDFGAPVSWAEFEVSLSGSSERGEWTLGIANEQEYRGDRGFESVFDGNEELTEARFERRFERAYIPKISGSFTRESERGNVLNLIGEVGARLSREREFSDQSSVDGTFLRTRTLRETDDEINFEIGFDYEFDLGPGRWKWIGLHRNEHSPTEDSVRFDFADGSTPFERVFEREADELETILRSEYTFGLWGGDAQLSVEGVRNVVDLESQLAERSADGSLVPVPFRGSSSRVEEDREEVTLSFSRALSPRLQLQASFGAEYSKLEQIGELGLTRDFVRPKGFLTLDWGATENLDISTKLERQVGQLDFSDFAASVNLNQEQVNVSNVNLVPPQTWLLETELNQSLGEVGSATLRLSYEEIDDIVDQIPIEGGGEAPGNIDSAERYGATLDLTLLSDSFAWRGGRLDLNLSFVESEVLDPLFGTPRRISGTDNVELRSELRQDFFGTDWATGLDLFYDEEGRDFRLDQITFQRDKPPFTSIYLEHKDIRGLTIRGTISNILDRNNNLSRTIFEDRAAGLVELIETRRREFGPIYSITIQGSF
ncbi:MAG: TonB-dependent receptor plug domain-containing protein [Acidobacteriota bacterium]